jgi:HAD superfamily hydrolase (TIGR01484 family)
MKPITEISEREISRVKGVLFDIDDTFTLDGRIRSEAFSALWKLHDKGFILVPITGRPAGWCDHIARMWPVDGVVGENGAFYYYYCTKKHKLLRRYIFEPDVAREKRALLEAIKQEVLKRVPGAGIAADQNFRLFDLAIDFAEDVPALSREEIDKVCDIFHAHHATCKVSSIHINGWFGDYNKLFTTKLFLRERLGLEWEDARYSFIFIGDSPNDEPMFEAFPLSIGVANVNRFLPMMRFPPAFITAGEGGLGFAEMAHVMVSSRAGKYGKEHP